MPHKILHVHSISTSTYSLRLLITYISDRNINFLFQANGIQEQNLKYSADTGSGFDDTGKTFGKKKRNAEIT